MRNQCRLLNEENESLAARWLKFRLQARAEVQSRFQNCGSISFPLPSPSLLFCFASLPAIRFSCLNFLPHRLVSFLFLSFQNFHQIAPVPFLLKSARESLPRDKQTSLPFRIFVNNPFIFNRFSRRLLHASLSSAGLLANISKSLTRYRASHAVLKHLLIAIMYDVLFTRSRQMFYCIARFRYVPAKHIACNVSRKRQVRHI